MATPTLNVEKLFISKILEDRDFTRGATITPEYFNPEEDYQKAFIYIRDYYAEYGIVPTEREFKSDNPKIPVIKVPESWDILMYRITKQYRTGLMATLLDPFGEAFDNGDIDDALNILSSAVAQMHNSNPQSRDVDVTKNGEDRLARYQERRDNPGLLVGVPTGFPSIDKATQGLQQGQLVTFTGLAKASKSTLSMLIALAIQAAGYRVLYLTYEMTVEEQERRMDAYRSGFNDNKLNSGLITDEEWLRLKQSIHQGEGLTPMMISEDCMTVSAVGAKADAFGADVVIIDGAYIMDDEQGEKSQSSQALTNIVKGLKLLAMRRSICVVAVTQSTPARTKGEELNNDSIMGSRAFIQYSNLIIGIERIADKDDPNSYESQKMRKLKILLSRSSANLSVMLEFDYDTAQFRELPEFDPDDYDEELEDGEPIPKY